MDGRKILSTTSLSFVFVVGLFIGILTVPVYTVVVSIFGGRHVQTVGAPETGSEASLYKKHNLADINFIVEVNGKTVFRSADLMPLVDGMYRETLIWDKSGRVVVFEMMGKRIFAYDALEKRQLNAAQLEPYVFWPTLADSYFYVDIQDLRDQ